MENSITSQEQPEQSFPKPSQKQNEPVPGPPPMQELPEQPVKRKSSLGGFFSFFILLFLFVIIIAVFVFMTMFINFSSLLHYYVAASVVSLASGAIIGMIANDIMGTSRGYLWACSLISCLAAGLVSTAVAVQVHLSVKLAELTQAIGAENVSVSSLFSNVHVPANPLVTSLLIIIFFNIPVLVMFFRRRDRKAMHLLIYALPLIIFLLVFFFLPNFLLSTFDFVV
jgi:pheromone shutdown protein TraB